MAETVVDAKGRTITLRVVDPTFALSLAEAAGDASANQGFMRLAALYLLADDIDGMPVPFPQDKDQLYAVARMLGNDGVAALSGYMSGKGASKDTEQAKN